jgi:L-lactate dehydrogenase
MKVGIVGAGMVGATAGFALVMNGVSDDVVLVDINERRARAQAEDLFDATPFGESVRVAAGDYEALRGAQVVLLCCGAAQRPGGETRLELASRNTEIFGDVVPQVVGATEGAVLVVAANPVDVLTDVTASIARLPRGRVFGSGTMLDTARFRTVLSAHLGISSDSVFAYVLGEHGDSEVLTWSSATVAGMPLAGVAASLGRPIDDEVKRKVDERVRRAAYRIIDGKGTTNFGIGATLGRLVRAIRDDERAVFTVSAPGTAETPFGDACFSLPRVLGSGGVLATLNPALSAAEEAAMKHSAEVVRAPSGTRSGDRTDLTLSATRA